MNTAEIITSDALEREAVLAGDDYVGQDGAGEDLPVAVADEDRADWNLRRIAILCAERERIGIKAQRERDLIDQWQDRQFARLENEIAWRERGLEQYARGAHAADPKRKTFTMAYGTLRLRKAKPKWTYDDVAMRAWIVENGADTLAKRELDRAAIRKAFKIEGDGDDLTVVDTKSGLVLDCATVMPAGEPTFSIDTNPV